MMNSFVGLASIPFIIGMWDNHSNIHSNIMDNRTLELATELVDWMEGDAQLKDDAAHYGNWFRHLNDHIDEVLKEGRKTNEDV